MIKALEEETGSCKNISGSEENRDQQHLEELKELKEANAKAEGDKIRENDLERRKTLGEDDTDVEEAGSEESLKDRELNLRRQA